MWTIKLKNIKIYAYHGCLEEEAKIGTFYLVNLSVKIDLSKAGKSDDLNDTLNYAELNEIIHKQMAIRSNLLENIADRIMNEIGEKYKQSYKQSYKQIVSAKIKITKLSPPLEGNMDNVSITLKNKFR